LLQTIITFIKDHPALAALLAFVVLVIDSLYIYRTLKRVWKRSTCNPSSRTSSTK